MAKQLQIRGGTTVQHSTFTGALREITIDTDKDVVVVHDGTTVGGFPLAKQTSVDSKVTKVTSTDNAVVRFNGTTGDVQNSGVIIDDNNNVGIGVTPSASGSTTHGIQTEYNYMGSQGGSGQIMYNAVPSSNISSKYVQSSFTAVSYEQNLSGQHVWKTAPSGTAGSPITWTNAMTLSSSGNLLVGTTTDNGVDKLQVNGIASALKFRSNKLSISAVAGTWVNISTLENGLHIITQSKYNSAFYGACMIVLVAEGTAFIVLNTGPAIILRMSGLVAQLNFPITMSVDISITTLN